MFKDRLALLTVATLLCLVSIPYALSFASPPPGLSFLGSFHDPFDTPVYLSAMRAGARGEWLRTLPFTSEHQTPALYYPFYILLGHLAPPTIYTFHLARLLIAVLLCLATWKLIEQCLFDPDERRVAFVLALLGMGAGWLVLLSGLWRIIRPTDLFAPTSTLFGASFINPHFPLTAALEFITFVTYLRARRQPQRQGTLLAGALACLVMGWLVPYALVPAALVMLVDAALATDRIRQLRVAIFILAPSAGTLLYYFLLTRFDPFWSQLVAQWPPLDHTFTAPEYLAGYGLSVFFAIVGAVVVWRSTQRTDGERLLIVWLVVNGLLITSPLDFSDRTSLGYSAPLAMLSAIALIRLARKHFKRLVTSLPRLAYLSAVPAPLLLMLSHVISVQQYTDVPYFLPQDDAAAIAWLGVHTGPLDIVLAAPALANQIPGLTDARVYSGHQFETFEPTRKNGEIATFFDAATSDADRISFLMRTHVTYVYAVPNMRRQGAFDGSSANYLEPIFGAGAIRLYRVTSNGR